MKSRITGVVLFAALLCPAVTFASPGPSGQIVFASDRAGGGGRDLYLQATGSDSRDSSA